MENNWISDSLPIEKGEYWVTIEYTDEQIEFLSKQLYWTGPLDRRIVQRNYWNGSFFCYITYGKIVAWMSIEKPEPYTGNYVLPKQSSNVYIIEKIDK